MVNQTGPFILPLLKWDAHGNYKRYQSYFAKPSALEVMIFV